MLYIGVIEKAQLTVVYSEMDIVERESADIE